jgi:hypothetical protein
MLTPLGIALEAISDILSEVDIQRASPLIDVDLIVEKEVEVLKKSN